MIQRPFVSQSGNRLAIAMVGALFVHGSLILAAHWGLSLFAVPSDTSRMLTFTLVNTPHEGLRDSELEPSETVNDVPVDEAKSVSPNKDKGELVSAPQLNSDGQVVPNQAIENAVATASDSEALEEQQQDASPMGAEQATDLQSTSIASDSSASEADAPPIDDAAIYLASDGELAISAVQGTPDLQAAEQVQVTESEQRMLDQKIRHWAETLNELEDVSQTVSWQELGQTYVASFSRVPASGEMDTDEVIVEVATEKDGERLTTQLRMKKMAFSNFGQFVHRWDPNISMHDDELTGRFHSNSRFNLEYTRRAKPLFTDKVTTASYRVNLNGPTSKKKIFLGGLETGVKRIAMPKPKMLFPEVETGIAEGHRENTVFVEQSSRLRFLAEGSVLIQSLKQASPPRKVMIGDEALYIMASPKAQLHVSGVVNGAVAVYSPKRIVIEGDLMYRSFEPVEQGGDFIGLVSGRSVVIPSRRITGEGDLTIHAAIYARGRFLVTHHEGARSGLLTVHGSVSAGSLSATEPRYATKIVFDRRLEDVRPPGFPVTDRYELAMADNGWTRTEINDEVAETEQPELLPSPPTQDF